MYLYLQLLHSLLALCARVYSMFNVFQYVSQSQFQYAVSMYIPIRSVSMYMYISICCLRQSRLYTNLRDSQYGFVFNDVYHSVIDLTVVSLTLPRTFSHSFSSSLSRAPMFRSPSLMLQPTTTTPFQI